MQLDRCSFWCLCVVMEQDTIDLIERLLVEAAIVMEDVSAAILIKDVGTLRDRISATARAGDKILALGKAAGALADG